MSQPKHDAQYLIKKHGPTEAVQIAEGRWREAEEESDRTYAAHCAAVLAYTEGFHAGTAAGALKTTPFERALQILSAIPEPDLRFLALASGLDIEHYNTKSKLVEGLTTKLGIPAPADWERWNHA